VNGLAQSYARLLDLFDRLDFGVAFCDSTGRVLAGNSSFRDLASAKDGLGIDHDRIVATSAEDMPAFRSCLVDATRPGADAARLVMALRRRSTKTPLIVKAFPVHEKSLQKRAHLALLLVMDPDRASSLSTEGLAGFGVLSPAELDVCRHILKGFGTDEIAERRSTSLNTARSQIKSASGKLSCHSRLDLVRLALSSAPPIRQGGIKREEMAKMNDKKTGPRKKILDGLENSTAEQWKEAWSKAQEEEERRDAWLKERIESGKKPAR